MGELVGLAYYESIERVSRIELVLAALKIQPCLAGPNRRRRCRLDRFLLGAHVLDFHVGRPDFVEYRFDDVPVRTGQHLAEDRTRDLHKQRLALGAVQSGWLKPSGEGVDTDPGFHVFQEFIPGIYDFAFAPNLSCSRHRKSKKYPLLFPQMCKSCGKQIPTPCILRASGFLPARQRSPLSAD